LQRDDTGAGADAPDVEEPSPDVESPEDVRDVDDAETYVGDDTSDIEPDATPRCERDRDSDGLTDCDELQMCTNPEDGDSDDDGLSDLEEIQHQTDPCDPDTDDDGVDDKTELKFGLDPHNPTTYGSKRDDELWFVGACEGQTQTERIDIYTNRTGLWQVALAPTLDHSQLEIQGASVPVAADVFAHTGDSVAGAVTAKEAPSSHLSPGDELSGTFEDALAQVGTIDDKTVGAEFDSRDGKPSQIGEYLVSVDQDRTLLEMRNEILFAATSFGKSDVTNGLPPNDGRSFGEFRVRVLVKYRIHPSGRTSHLVEFAVAPETTFSGDEQVWSRLHHVTTNNLADLQAVRRDECELMKLSPAGNSPTPNHLSLRPVPTSMRVYVDDEWVPRSRQDGYDYKGTRNSVSLLGDYLVDESRPDDEPPVWMKVAYQWFLDRCPRENTCDRLSN
jgi:hypothetical protein